MESLSLRAICDVALFRKQSGGWVEYDPGILHRKPFPGMCKYRRLLGSPFLSFKDNTSRHIVVF